MIYIFRYSDKPYFKTVSVFTTIAWLGLKVPDFMIYLGPVLINNRNQIDHTLSEETSGHRAFISIVSTTIFTHNKNYNQGIYESGLF